MAVEFVRARPTTYGCLPVALEVAKSHVSKPAKNVGHARRRPPHGGRPLGRRPWRTAALAGFAHGGGGGGIASFDLEGQSLFGGDAGQQDADRVGNGQSHGGKGFGGLLLDSLSGAWVGHPAISLLFSLFL